MEGAAASASTSAASAVIRRRPSRRELGSLSPRRPAAAPFSCQPPYDEETPHFLDACHLCRRPLSRYRDIFMYRGDTPFCSEECRQEQIELDEAREEEEASYWRSQRRGHRSGRRVGEESGAIAAADAPGVAVRTAVAG